MPESSTTETASTINNNSTINNDGNAKKEGNTIHYDTIETITENEVFLNTPFPSTTHITFCHITDMDTWITHAF